MRAADQDSAHRGATLAPAASLPASPPVARIAALMAALIAAVAGLAGCADQRTRERDAPVARTFAATVPCAADCATLSYRITLFPDRSYWYDRRQLGADGSSHFEFREVGRYSEDAGLITLNGTRDAPERWRRVTDQALRLVDATSADEGAGAAVALVSQAAADREFGPVRLRGNYRREGLAGTLESCEAGVAYLVAGGEGLASLALEYSRGASREGAPLLVAVQARFVAPAAERAAGPTLPIMVDSFERAVPGAACDGRPPQRTAR